MENFIKFERACLYPYYRYTSDENDPIQQLLTKVSIGSYVEALQEEICIKALYPNQKRREANTSFLDFYKNNLLAYLETAGQEGEQVVLCIGISCLQLFTQSNFCGPLNGATPSDILPELITEEGNEDSANENVLKELVLDAEEIYGLLTFPEYLLLARVIFYELKNYLASCLSVNWWFARYGIIHQQVVEEYSQKIYESLLDAVSETEKKEELVNDLECRELAILFHLEACHLFLYYYNIAKAKYHFETAMTKTGMDITLTGAMGKRTKWQNEAIAQLVVKVSYKDLPITDEELPGPSLLPTDLPKDVVLLDDTRLNKIDYTDKDEDMIPDLKAIEQVALLANLILKRRSQAQDCQLTEETKSFLTAILQYPKNWSLQFSALILRSRVEANEFRAMERSLNQYEELVKSVQNEEPSRYERLKLIYSSYMITHWNLQQEHARMLMKLGCIKTALEIFERLHLWEDVIICYNELQMRQRSAEIIEGLIAKEETPKLWCLLGDSTDNIECYEKAWKLSGEKSGRAQRSLGNYYYTRRNYAQALEHYEKSVEINSLQFIIWQRLAYCALQAAQWDKCAKAYIRCTILEPDSFECWNNMSTAYLRLGETYKAWKALEEADRCSVNNFMVIENYLVVSTSLGYMNQALNAYNKMLQFNKKYVDTEILGKIVNAVIENKKDPDGRELKLIHKKCAALLGNLSMVAPTKSEIWYLYAELTYYYPDGSEMTKHTAMQRYRKSVAAASQFAGWVQQTDSTKEVLMRSLRLLEVCQEVSADSNAKAALADLSSIRMLIKSCITLIKRAQVNVNTGELDENIQSYLTQVENEFEKLNHIIDTLRSTSATV